MDKHPKIVAWLKRGTTHDINIRINGDSQYKRKKPYELRINKDNKSIEIIDGADFGKLFGQICYVARCAFQKKGKASQLVRWENPVRKKRRIPSDAFAHQHQCEKAGACEPYED